MAARKKAAQEASAKPTPDLSPRLFPEARKEQPESKKGKAAIASRGDSMPTGKYAPGSLEKFETKQVTRDQIHGAPYNPRTIGDEEKRRLEGILKKHGLVEPLIWNKRTGNLVGGHQRISILDKLYGTKNYPMTVAVVDVDEAGEKELNIALNNPRAQGEYDIERLTEMIKTPGLEAEGMGYSTSDLQRMFGTDVLVARSADGDVRELDELSQKLDKFRERYEGVRDELRADRDDPNFFIVLVFKNRKEVIEMCERLGYDPAPIQDGRELRNQLDQSDEMMQDLFTLADALKAMHEATSAPMSEEASAVLEATFAWREAMEQGDEEGDDEREEDDQEDEEEADE